MAVEDQPPFATGHGVLRREAFAASVAAGREGGGSQAEAKADPISELLGREVGAVERVAHFEAERVAGSKAAGGGAG